ncbi:MAG: SDR family oxidoreductase [Xanthobacteraceae bacterium]
MKLEKRTVLITGGTSGIGLELAKQLHRRGNTVIVTGRDQEKLDATRRALPGVHTFKSDVSDPGAIAALHDSVLAQCPALDMLVNNAGIMRNLNLNQDRGLNDVTREIEINLSGPVRMVQQFLPHLKTRKGALIVNVSSGLAFIPYPASPVYCATKAAIHSFTQSLRVQLDGTGVTVIELAPPPVETPLMRAEFAEELKAQKGMEANVLAKRAIAGIEAGKLEIRPGLSNVLQAMSRIAPQFMLKQMTKMAKAKKSTEQDAGTAHRKAAHASHARPAPQ